MRSSRPAVGQQLLSFRITNLLQFGNMTSDLAQAYLRNSGKLLFFLDDRALRWQLARALR